MTAALAPTVTVTLPDGSTGSLAAVIVSTRIAATWQAQAGQVTVVAIRILGGDHQQSGADQ